MINSDEDGITHINIYSKGKTELGRLLSNFAYTPVNLGDDGKFDSLEGYWYWLLSKKDDEANALKMTYGWQAKALGRQLKIPDYPSQLGHWLEFQRAFKKAMFNKLIQTEGLLEQLSKSTLPFKHYYVYNGKVSEPKGCEWMMEYWEEIRKNLNE